METIELIIDFLLNVTLLTLGQLSGFFGLTFIFGLLLYFLSRSTRRLYQKSAGSTLDIVLTGWIGAPVHELGHAVFCLLFWHRIERMKLFDPDPRDGTLGYVIHSYNPRNIYQRIGNFFIGTGPLIFGAIVIYLAMIWLLPETDKIFGQLMNQTTSIGFLEPSNWFNMVAGIYDGVVTAFSLLFRVEHLAKWEFWVFIYFSASVASHMELSPPDIRSALIGFANLLLVLFVFNLVVLLIELIGFSNLHGFIWSFFSDVGYHKVMGTIAGIMTALFMFAATVSAINFLITWALMSIANAMAGKGIVNPFWG